MLLVQIGPDHHSENNEQILGRDQSVLVEVVEVKGESVFVLFGSSKRKLRKSLNELDEGDFPIFVLVEAFDYLLGKGILSEGGYLHEGVHRQIVLAIGVQLGESLVEFVDFRRREDLVDGASLAEIAVLLTHSVL